MAENALPFAKGMPFAALGRGEALDLVCMDGDWQREALSAVEFAPREKNKVKKLDCIDVWLFPSQR